jgi:hypothetical protein
MRDLPELHQLELHEKNSCYLCSVFLGFIVPIMHIPTMLFKIIINPLIRGMLVFLFLIVMFPYLGLRGRIKANNLSFNEAFEKHFNRENV